MNRRPAALDPALPLAAEFCRVARAELDIGIAGATDRRLRQHERIHEGRKCCKKIRALLRLSRSSDRRTYARENLRLRQAAHLLADARDAHVLQNTLALLRHGPGRPLKAVEQSHLEDALARARDGGPTPFEAFARQLRLTRSWLSRWTPHDDSDLLLIDLRKGYARCRRALARVRRKKNSRAFHEWRKTAKLHFYQVRYLRQAGTPGMKSLLNELKRLCDELGREHDFSILRKKLKRLSREKNLQLDPGVVAAGLRACALRRAQLRERTLRRGERLLAEKPRRFAARVAPWWDRAAEATAPRAAAR
jgi:CHAD domain-containing protein